MTHAAAKEVLARHREYLERAKAFPAWDSADEFDAPVSCAGTDWEHDGKHWRFDAAMQENVCVKCLAESTESLADFARGGA